MFFHLRLIVREAACNHNFFYQLCLLNIPSALQCAHMEAAQHTGPDIESAVEIIDRTLGSLTSRELVTTSEVTDALLEVRFSLQTQAKPEA